MLLSNAEMYKVYHLSVSINQDVQIYILPVIYLLVVYGTWRIRRISFDLFFALLGIAFFSIVLLTPASPGWFMWIVPLLVWYQNLSDRVATMLVLIFTGLYVLSSLMIVPSPFYHIGGDELIQVYGNITSLVNGHHVALLHTALFVIGIILIVRIWREAIRSNDYFRLSRKPFIMGISGDSGAGKDTLASSIEGLLGKESTVHVSGDDYHLWDRHKPMWQVMTHLNPRANDLERYAKDLGMLANGRAIQSRRYDHSVGKMTRPESKKSNDFILASGLHALHLPMLRQRYDLSIYLDIDETLRKYFKIQRDVNKRGHPIERVLSSLEKREMDAVKFVRPQRKYADLVLALLPVHHLPKDLAEPQPNLRLKLKVLSRNGFNEDSLIRVLVGICGLHVDLHHNETSDEIEMLIEGEVEAEDMRLSANTPFPDMGEFLDSFPSWENGIPGLMQLIVLSHMNQALNKRLA
ncbi:hypothetical protein GCM10011332_20940 [Terasakiella brassicae]|uniref:phosphoribulokinase n=2 Tax=Terasakiella brassicae TaxID=1634917 RepID=A0A917FB62_9PROT|nr:hypothetical protein GCM10011332_20940 [Terasakiella brassicae]